MTLTLLARSPQCLLIVATGNITNPARLALFEDHLEAIAEALDEADLVELGASALVVYRRREDGPSA